MGVLSGLRRFLGVQPRPPGPRVLEIKCKRCGEIVPVRVDPRIQAGAEFGPSGTTYHLRKVVVGNRCPHRMELHIDYDENYHVTRREVKGGELG